jgi:hypothetical protein
LESPVLETIRSVPLPVFIMVLVEELDSLESQSGESDTSKCFLT